MDHQKFGKRVRELLHWKSLHQKDLADSFGFSKGYINQVLTGIKPLTPDFAKACIRFLAENGAIIERKAANDLLELAGCEDFSETDWTTWPLNRLIEDTSVSLQSIDLHSAPTVPPFDEEAARVSYLEQVIRWYSFLTLPAGSLKSLRLPSVFQSLPLRQEGFFPEELAYADRRALLDELTRSEDDPRRKIPGDKASEAYRGRTQQTPFMVAADGFDALTKSTKQRMVIVGSPGSGKTTLLKYLMIETARKAQAHLTDLLPLFISLPEFVGAGLSLEDYLLETVVMLGIDKRYAAILEKTVKAGKAFICLDTLDQISSHRRREVITWINVQASEPGNVWIISTRFNEYGGAQFLPPFPEWELTPLTHQAREQLAQGLFSELAQRTSDGANAQFPTSSQFVSALEKHRQAAHWGKNPLLFSLALNSFYRTGAFPSSRVALYKETIATLVATRQENRNRQVALQRTVAALALHSYEDRQRLLTRGTLREHVVTIRRDQEEIWDVDEMTQALIDSGILEVVAKDTYGFWHQTFREYFASVELARRLIHQRTRQASWNFLMQKHLSGRWTEVLRLMVGVLVQEYAPQGGIPTALFWLRELVKQRTQPHGDVGDLALALAIKSLGEIGEQSWFWHDPGWLQLEEEVTYAWTEALIETIKRNQMMRQRRLLQLIDDLCQLKLSTVSSLIEALEAKMLAGNAQTREVLIVALGKFACYAPVQLLPWALGDRHKTVRAAVVKALIAMGNDAPVNDLRKALQSERVLLREAATQVIGGLRRPDLQEEILPGLSDESWKVQLATVQALGELGEHAPRDKLVECLQNENEIVRYAAVEALGKLGNSMLVEELIGALDDPDDWVRGAVIDVLGEKTPADRLVDAVLNPAKMLLPLRTSADAARDVLARQGEQALFEMLRAYGIADDQELRDLVMFIKDPESQQELSTEEILEALHGNHEENRRRAVRILSERGERKLLEAVLTSRETVHQITCATVLRMVGKLHEPLLMNETLHALDDPDPKIRLAAINALKDLGEQVPESIVGVEKLLEEEEDRQISTIGRAPLSGD
jgi:HEAT repeat protein/transcriptional regulator with XRE-family HTH domain